VNPAQKVVVAVPAYNCAPQIGRVLDEITDEVAARVAEIWVIDNRSTDDTLERALEYRRGGRLAGLRVFRNRQNNSLGGTHKVAFEHARAAGMTHVVILHGDNQAKSDEIALLLDHAAAHPETQTVLGSRFSRHSRLHGYDAKRVWGNRVLNGVYSAVALRPLQDLGSGLNLFALRDLDPARYLRFADHLTFNYELILDLVARKVRFAYVPITWREEDQVSNARNWNVFRTALRNLALWRLGRPTSQPAPDRDYEWDEVS
jgi:glycosyltransferase involved in cell wall biosynthesis